MKVAVFTIAAANYLARVRVLFESLRLHQPDWLPHWMLVDEIQDRFDASAEPFRVLEAQTLGLENFQRLMFRSTLIEACTAVKPRAIQWLFEQGFEAVVYLDPDILVTAPLAGLEEALLSGASCILTPHRLEADEGRMAGLPLLQAGAFNLGFVALAGTESRALLDWWSNRLEEECLDEPERGLFVDQRWMDLAPALDANVRIQRHPGWNVAWWNEDQRPVTLEGERWMAAGSPLIFFHFSHLPALAMENLSDFSTHPMDADGSLAALVNRYRNLLQDHGEATCARWPWHYGRAEGLSLSPWMKKYLRSRRDWMRYLGSRPFERMGQAPQRLLGGFFPQLLRRIWAERRDLRRQFRKNPFLAWPRFWRWYQRHGRAELGLKQGWSLNWKRLFEFETRAPAVPLRSQGEGFQAGLDLVGLIRTEIGIGQACRMTAQGLEEAGLPYSILDLSALSKSRSLSTGPWLQRVRRRATRRVALLHLSPGDMSTAHDQFGDDLFRGQTMIGYWHWELARLPKNLWAGYEGLHEMWAPTRFVYDALRLSSPVPVKFIPGAVATAPDATLGRAHFGLPERAFLFLGAFDVHSVPGRKNPWGALAAFQEAFEPQRTDVGLVLKVNNGAANIEHRRALRAAVEGWPNIRIIDRTMAKAAMDALIVACDCTLSLHRSEGFGLLMAEGQTLGKLSIATGWSGNVDFMADGRGALVDYRLVPVGSGQAPYDPKELWAEPDLQHASALMRRAVADPAWAKAIAQKGHQKILEEHSPLRHGQHIVSRLRELGLHED